MSAMVIVLPVMTVERFRAGGGGLVHRIDVGNQRLLPSSDRRNVIELWRVRIDREYREMGVLKDGPEGAA
jgi:hypothetical protein